MITTGRKQLIGVMVFFVAVAALGALLMKRREVGIVQQPVETSINVLKDRLKAASDPAMQQRLEYERSRTRDPKVSAKLDGQLKSIKEDSGRVEGLQADVAKAEAQKKALMPLWVRILSWTLPFLALLAFMAAMSLATEHGKRFLVTCAMALMSIGFVYFRGVSRGIDLEGGAELRYQLDTSAIDREIGELETLDKELTSAPAETRQRIEAEIAEKEKRRKGSTSDVITMKLTQEIELLGSYLKEDGIKGRIDLLRGQRNQDVTKATDAIRRRIDSAGIREISVQTGSDGRLIAQLPIRSVPLSKGEILSRLRDRTGAAKWDGLGQSERDELVKAEERRLSQEQLELDISELQVKVETPGQLAFNDVDACNGYQRDADRWQKVLDWDKKGQDLRTQLETTTDQARRKELEAQIAALQAKHPAPGFVLKEYKDIKDGRETSEQLLLREKPVTTGEYLSRAFVVGAGDVAGGQKVLVNLDAAGGAAMYRYTDEGNRDFGVKHKETRMAILLDGVVKSAPTINDRLDGNFEITGRFTKAEADQLAEILNAGSLAFKPARESVQVVGPGLGEDSISAGVRASLVGSMLVVAFMAIYYLAGGVAANLALGLNLLMILGAMSLLGGTLTLPGIAGIALTVGMAVDANVLIFERVREEKARGKPLKLALKAGQERALITILDSNFTTMIIAFFLYLFGTGPVKGFAVTLTLGLLVNLFTALYVTKAVMEYLHGRGWLTEFKMMKVVGVPKISWMKGAPVMGVVSTLLVAGSLFLLFSTKNKLGLDFTGGLELQVKLADQADTGKVRAVADKVKDAMEAHLRAADKAAAGSISIGECSVQAYEPDTAGKSRQFRISSQLNSEQQQVLDQAPGKAAGDSGIRGFFSAGFAEAGVKLDASDPFPMMSKVGSRAASELQGKAILAFVFSLVAMFIYIVLRFDFMIGFGLGAVLSLFHDAAVAVGALMIANRMGMAGAQIDLVIVAAVLTIVGFSINDTIVIFDRIRENRPAMRSMSLREVVDLSVNQTLSRTILTSSTVFIAVMCLLLLGGGTLRPFALVFTAGVVVGTYSSVFIATSVGVVYENWRDRRREVLKQKIRSAPVQTA